MLSLNVVVLAAFFAFAQADVAIVANNGVARELQMVRSRVQPARTTTPARS